LLLNAKLEIDFLNLLYFLIFMRIIDKIIHQNYLLGVVYSGDKIKVSSDKITAPEWLIDVLNSEYTGGNIIAKFWEKIPDKKTIYCTDEDWIHFSAIFGITKLKISFPIYNGFCPIANCEDIDPNIWYDDEKMWVTSKNIKINGIKSVEVIEKCPICDTADSNVITSCGHQYCLHCIVSWNSSCPICRTEKYQLFTILSYK
jgi:hypothetical protein